MAEKANDDDLPEPEAMFESLLGSGGYVKPPAPEQPKDTSKND